LNFSKTFIEDLYLIELNSFKDNRGLFVKTFYTEIFVLNGLESSICESFYSVSHKNVIRGMHFQIPPDDHAKLVSLISGRIIDVVLDIRKESKTFGKYFSIELGESVRNSLYIGRGLAHGFLSLEDNSIVEYHTTSLHSQFSEMGIHYDSFGFEWNADNPIVSERDNNFIRFDQFNSPF
jgi:dTDP-4-dehydrorhamnose 3,5-epimerase/CDP-3, 6-dideoxy-D-glycero-D-glycero-4-hexulose-5-epimerase